MIVKESVGIEINSLVKTKYIQNYENLDLTGGVLEVKYEDGSKTEVEITSEMVTGYEKVRLGEQEITVSYGGFKATFKVTVRNDVIDIEIKTKPNKVKYIKGEELDLTGGILEVTYEDRTTEEVEITTGMVTGYDENVVGIQNVGVGYKNFRTSFTVEVTNNITGIAIKDLFLELLDSLQKESGVIENDKAEYFIYNNTSTISFI